MCLSDFDSCKLHGQVDDGHVSHQEKVIHIFFQLEAVGSKHHCTYSSDLYIVIEYIVVQRSYLHKTGHINGYSLVASQYNAVVKAHSGLGDLQFYQIYH